MSKIEPQTRTPSPPSTKTGPVVIKPREVQLQELVRVLFYSKCFFFLTKPGSQMMSVRKNLTEILLEVTNEEIRSIARETHTRMKTKGRKNKFFFISK